MTKPKDPKPIAPTPKDRPKKKSFSSFTLKAAYQQLNLDQLLPWTESIQPQTASAFFQERMARLQRHFDLKTCEDARKLLIDAVCETPLYALSDLSTVLGWLRHLFTLSQQNLDELPTPTTP